MTNDRSLRDEPFNEDITHHYSKAAEELLYAYQTNQEAVRCHAMGALKSAKHHAQIAQNHAFIAHEHISEALKESQNLREKLSTQSAEKAQKVCEKMKMSYRPAAD
jgi:hypothetical protein